MFVFCLAEAGALECRECNIVKIERFSLISIKKTLNSFAVFKHEHPGASGGQALLELQMQDDQLVIESHFLPSKGGEAK